MKHVHSNGHRLIVRESSEPLLELRVRGVGMPLPIIDQHMSDERAREIVRDLMQTGRYERAR